MRYRATNGITDAVLSESEARADFDRAQYVVGEFGGTFVTCPVGEYGRLLSLAATTYTPIRDKLHAHGAAQRRERGRDDASGARWRDGLEALETLGPEWGVLEA
jgi:hypothetical protein